MAGLQVVTLRGRPVLKPPSQWAALLYWQKVVVEGRVHLSRPPKILWEVKARPVSTVAVEQPKS